MLLIEKRKEKGMTQAQVAAASNIHRAAYCNIEKGKRQPSVSVAKRIAETLNFDWTEFFAN